MTHPGSSAPSMLSFGPRSWPDPATLPTSAEVSLAHQRNPELTLEQVQHRERESLAERLD